MEIKQITKRLSLLLKKPSVVRYEQPFIDYLAKYCQRYKDYEITQTDRLLLIKKRNSNSKKIISAHIDRQGFVANEKGEIEYAAFQAKKYYNQENESDEYVFAKATSRYIGEQIFAYDPVTGDKLTSGKIIGARYDFDNKKVIYDTTIQETLPAGIPLALESTLKTQKNYIYSQIDNVISVSVAIQLLKNGFDGTVLFSTEEEIGRSWMHIRDYLIENDLLTHELIVLDTTPYKYVHSIDKGLVVLRNKDETGVFNKKLLEDIKTLCEEKNILFECKDQTIEKQNEEWKKLGEEPRSYGHTELGRLVEHTNGKINGATIQIPTVHYHTNQEMTSLESLRNYYELLKKLLL